MRRIRVLFAGISVEFVDRDRALEQMRELGIGRYMVWQTPLHREAVRKALEHASSLRYSRSSPIEV